jgi:hypothetical protein
MRCSNCGKKVKKKSSFCIKCGAKIPPPPKKEKKQKKQKNPKEKKKRSKAKIVIPFLLILFLALIGFLILGGDKVPEKVRDLKGYQILTGIVKEKLPEQMKLPFALPEKLPFNFSLKLPFELPNPGNILGDSKVPDKKKIGEELATSGGEEKKIEFDTLTIEKRKTGKKTDLVYVMTEKKADAEAGTDAEIGYYCLTFKKRLIGGWKLDTVKPYNVAGEKTSVAGVDNKTVLGDEAIFSDISTDWKKSNAKVLNHYTDLKAGTDTVIVYMEVKNSYVNMAGTKEVTYTYNEKTKKWENTSVSKFTCHTIEPVAEQQTAAQAP